MKRAVFPFLLILIGLAAEPVAIAQSANKIIDRYKRASGGDKVKRVKSTVMSGTVKKSDGATGSFAIRLAVPDRLRIDMEAGNQKISECYNGKSAWRVDARGLRTLLGAEAKRLRLEALIANRQLENFARNRILLEPPVKTSVDGK